LAHWFRQFHIGGNLAVFYIGAKTAPECYMVALLVDAGRLEEAEECLKKALGMNGDIPQARKELEQIRALYPGL